MQTRILGAEVSSIASKQKTNTALKFVHRRKASFDDTHASGGTRSASFAACGFPLHKGLANRIFVSEYGRQLKAPFGTQVKTLMANIAGARDIVKKKRRK
jgi:hypothetical protein